MSQRKRPSPSTELAPFGASEEARPARRTRVREVVRDADGKITSTIEYDDSPEVDALEIAEAAGRAIAQELRALDARSESADVAPALPLGEVLDEATRSIGPMLFEAGRKYERAHGPNATVPVTLNVAWQHNRGAQSQPAGEVTEVAPRRPFGFGATDDEDQS